MSRCGEPFSQWCTISLGRFVSVKTNDDICCLQQTIISISDYLSEGKSCLCACRYAFLCVCMYVFMCVHVCIHVCACKYAFICVGACICTHGYVCAAMGSSCIFFPSPVRTGVLYVELKSLCMSRSCPPIRMPFTSTSLATARCL